MLHGKIFILRCCLSTAYIAIRFISSPPSYTVQQVVVSFEQPKIVPKAKAYHILPLQYSVFRNSWQNVLLALRLAALRYGRVRWSTGFNAGDLVIGSRWLVVSCFDIEVCPGADRF